MQVIYPSIYVSYRSIDHLSLFMFFPLWIYSDAFTGWNSDEDIRIREKNNDEVTEATKRLYEQLIPKFGEELDQLSTSSPIKWYKVFGERAKGKHILGAIEQLLSPRILHERGINLRHLVR